MAQDAAPATPARGAGCALAFLAGLAGIGVGVVLTVVLWNLVGPDDAEEAPIGLLVVIGLVVVPSCFWISTVGALAWWARRDDGDVVGRSLDAGIVGAISGLLLSVLTWSLARDSDDGLALGGLAGLVVVLVPLGAALAIAWHRRGHTA